MYRKIQSHYAGTCNSCKKFFEAGTMVYWQKSTYGFFCVSCYEKAGNVAKKSGGNSDTTFTVDWRDLRKFVVDVIEDNPVKMRAGNLNTAKGCISQVRKGIPRLHSDRIANVDSRGILGRGFGAANDPEFAR
jgi:hypothetical protein